MEILISPDGQVKSLTGDDLSKALAGEGEAVTRRVTRVEPVNLLLRGIFLIIRKNVPDTHRLAAWTRTWNCRWQARIFDGPTLRGPDGRGFAVRQDAIKAETEYLNPKLVLGELV
jgi:hypothetical protein